MAYARFKGHVIAILEMVENEHWGMTPEKGIVKLRDYFTELENSLETIQKEYHNERSLNS